MSAHGQHFRDVVQGILRAAHVPIIEPGENRSGVVVSGNGRMLRAATLVEDGGTRSPGLWAAWLLVAVELLRSKGFPVAIDRNGVRASVGSPPARQIVEAAHG